MPTVPRMPPLPGRLSDKKRKRDKIAIIMTRRDTNKRANRASVPVALPDSKIDSSTREANILNNDPKPQPSASTSVRTYLLSRESGWWEAVAAWALLIVSIIAIVVTLHQLGAMANQTRLMQKQLEAATRAWIKVNVEARGGVTRLSDGRGVVPYNIHLNNVGNAVASDATSRSIGFVILHPGTDMAQLTSRQARVCEASPAPPPPNGTLPAIFPADAVDIPAQLYLSKTEVDSWLSGTSRSFGTGYQAFIVGCVDYKYFGSVERHVTSFIYLLDEPTHDPAHLEEYIPVFKRFDPAGSYAH